MPYICGILRVKTILIKFCKKEKKTIFNDDVKKYPRQSYKIQPAEHKSIRNEDCFLL